MMGKLADGLYPLYPENDGYNPGWVQPWIQL
jgi:hypothetical protein